MPLTPQDVENKLFTKTFRGYDMEEVDGFLDEVEAELVRLLRENNDVKVGGPRPTTAAPAQKASGLAPAAGPAADSGIEAADVQQAALRVLGMAEQTLSSARLEAAEQLASARAEAAALIESARTEADATLTAAREEAETLRGSAQEELDKTLAPARAEAERLQTTSREQAERALVEARTEADRLSGQARAAHEKADADLAAKMQGATRGLEARRTSLETHIEDLRSFEREYRSRLKAYLVSQLGDLEGRVVPEDGGAGVPAPARTAGTFAAAAPDLDLSNDAPDLTADAEGDVPLGQRAAPPLPSGAPGVGPFRSGPDPSNG